MATQPNVGYFDVKTGQWRAATPAEQNAALEARARQHRQARNSFLKGAALATGGMLVGGAAAGGFSGAGGAGASSASPLGFAGGAPITTAPLATLPGAAAGGSAAALNAMPAGWTPGWENAVGGGGGGGGGVNTAANVLKNTGGGGDGFFRASDLMRYGLPAALSTATTLLGNRSANRNADLSLEEQRRQFDATQKFLADQQAQTHQDYLDWVGEQKRQFDMTEAEKLRQWEAMEPWREAGRGNLTRMNSLMDEPRQMPTEYKPTFQYRP